MGSALIGFALFGEKLPTVTAACFICYALAYGLQTSLNYVLPNRMFETELRSCAVGFVGAISRIGCTTSSACNRCAGNPFACRHRQFCWCHLRAAATGRVLRRCKTLISLTTPVHVTCVQSSMPSYTSPQGSGGPSSRARVAPWLDPPSLRRYPQGVGRQPYRE